MFIQRWLPRVLFCCLVVLTSTAIYGCAGTNTTNTGEPQHIQQAMEPAPLSGQSIADYTKVLSTGDEVSGTVQVTGEWEVAGDWCTPWTFEALSPDGVMLNTATISPMDSDLSYTFKFTADAGGEYTIRVIHRSLISRYLDILISPPGWQYKETQTT